MKIILISQRREKNGYGEAIDVLEAAYSEYFQKFNVLLVPLSNSLRHVESCYLNFQVGGLILSGGNDINPKLYDQPEISGLNISDERDEVEKQALELAIAKHIPVLGICRGMQFINVFFGGRLADVSDGAKNHVTKSHPVHFIDEKIADLVGSEANVNSYHGSGVLPEGLAPKLTAYAQAKDGALEGVFHQDLPIAGLQWHPERVSPNEALNECIIEMFLNKKLYWSK